MSEAMPSPIPWLRISIEGVVIVISIILALAADAWWQEREDRLEELAIIEGLVSDFGASLAELGEVIGTHDDFDRRLVRLEAMARSELPPVPADSQGAYVRAMFAALTFEARDGTLDAMIASGKLGLIKDVRLRDVLLEWKARVSDLSEEAHDLRSAGSRVLDRMSELGGPWGFGVDVGGRMVAVPRVAEGLRQFPPPDLALATKDSDLMARVRSKRFATLLYLTALIPLLEHARSVLALIDSQRT